MAAKLRPGCPLCDEPGGQLVVQTPRLRVIRATEAGFPAFYRVVWQDHVAELSELSRAERQTCMDAVVTVEQALRRHLQPTKINLAALGNLVPHLHWHVIARFDWDSTTPRRCGPPSGLMRRQTGWPPCRRPWPRWRPTWRRRWPVADPLASAIA